MTATKAPTMKANLHDFLHHTTYEDLPEHVRGFARRWLLDLIGVAAGGRRTHLSHVIHDHAARHFGGHGAQLLFDGRMVSPSGAALAGGMTIDSLDAHDGHKLTKGHVGCGVFPSLLAMAQAEEGMTAKDFLTALAIGYEIGTRAGIALHRTDTDYHTSGAWIAVAVAALGARVLRLDATKTREAMGIAEYHGPRSQMLRTIDHPTMVRDGSGWGAMAGVSPPPIWHRMGLRAHQPLQWNRTKSPTYGPIWVTIGGLPSSISSSIQSADGHSPHCKPY